MKKRVTRKVQRFPARLLLQELNGRPVPDAFLVDISSLGAQLESPLSPARNTPVEFVIRFPWGDKDTRLSGSVRWVRPLIGQPGRFRVGLHFFSAFWELDLMARQGKL